MLTASPSGRYAPLTLAPAVEPATGVATFDDASWTAVQEMEAKEEKLRILKPTPAPFSGLCVGEVIPGFLFVGSKIAADNEKLLAETLGITHILTVASGMGPPKYPHRFVYSLISIEDSPGEPLAPHAESIVAFIESARRGTGPSPDGAPRDSSWDSGASAASWDSSPEKARAQYASLDDFLGGSPAPACPATDESRPGESAFKGRVLVHCLAGVSRSVSAVILYLLKTGRARTVAEALERVKAVRGVAEPNPGFLRQLRAMNGEPEPEASVWGSTWGAISSWGGLA